MPLQKYTFFPKWWPQVLLNCFSFSAGTTKERLCHPFHLQTTNPLPSTLVTGQVIFRTIFPNPTLAFFSIYQILLTTDLIFYKRSKDVLGFLDEEMKTNKVLYVHNRL